MKDIGVFDVIGPVMVGPSSSHTAGALKIALIASKMASSRITKARFVLYGSFARTYKGHGTDRALLAGIMGFGTDDLRIRDSFQLAKESGLDYTFEINEAETDLHPNTVDIFLSMEDGGEISVRGVSTGGGNCRIEKINHIDVDLTGNYPTLLICQRDTSGVVAYITKCLSESGINIAFMKLYRESRGQTAYTIIETDSDIPVQVTQRVRQNQEIESAMIIKI